MNSRIDSIKNTIIEKLKEKNKTTLILVFGIVGILLVGLSSIFNSDSKATVSQNTEAFSTDTAAYKKELESELVNILKQIQGVGEVSVMITIEGSTEYIYAEEYSTKYDSSSDKTSKDYQNQYVIVDNGKTKEALVKKVLKPSVTGVIVVCEGGNSLSVQEKILTAVSAVLDLSTNKICVAKG